MNRACSHRPLILKAGNFIMLYDKKALRVFVPKLKLGVHHKCLHSLSSSGPYPHSFIRDVLDNPLEILSLGGNTEFNLFIFLVFIHFDAPQTCFPLSALSECKREELSTQQEIFVELLLLNKKYWNELFQHDIKAAVKFCKYLRLAPSELCDDELLLEMIYCFKEVKNKMKNLNLSGLCCIDPELVEKYSWSTIMPIVIHFEFCDYRRINSCLHHFIANYSRLISDIESNRLPRVLFDEVPFYQELAMVNEYVILGGDLMHYNKRLLETELVTENEKKIKKFIVESLKADSWQSE